MNNSEPADRSYRRALPWRLFTAVTGLVDQVVGWDRLPVPLGLLELIGLRTKLRQDNLYDTGHLPAVDPPEAPAFSRDYLTGRTADGSHNDLDRPATGMAGTRFGRNIPLDRIAAATETSVLSPNPREISRALLTRTTFVPASSVNSLVAAWLQFMIRDWFSHGKSPKDNPWEVPLAADDPWPERPMRIMRTPDDPTRPAGADQPQTRVNVLTHWWDGSQIYGVDRRQQQWLRSGEGGKLRVLDSGLLPLPDDPADNPALVPGFWLGPELLRTLFTLEHNAICDRLHADYPSWPDEELFQRARLVNSALLAKIHTVEWTPAVISHPTTKAALRANWFGLAGERVQRLFGRISDSEVVSGIPGGSTDDYGVPFSLTEEFVAVYRMHPLLRDHWDFRSVADDQTVLECDFPDLAGENALKVLNSVSLTDLLYSFGTLPPGLVTLHNFPRHLQEFHRPDGHLQDLAATDVLRSRELGVPRYNEFRRLLHLRPARDFDELTGNRQWAEEISRCYGGRIEDVDLTVGMFAERKPAGFAFSDTAFRVFILMASRRLNSDRFFTEYYTPAVYSQTGLDWIRDNSMLSVLLRHYPGLRPAVAEVDNAFAAWPVRS
ncbi:Animal haem peroxidase [Amycolatopsis sacchari]|uniref:Animal haem peroxidase n=1 Tax=Amycolatopsis sacchari TaxID=115433 RepID=A0A1I3KKA6_9PSEU|nr:peroxidase family protein [Amycolatopsis sacchari]SFI72951.1 Animal haem peroxidase [Amycolatopsis sacchari]